MTQRELEAALGRPERSIPIEYPLDALDGERILVTGAKGSIGTALVETFEAAGLEVVATDIDNLGVRCFAPCANADACVEPTLVFHLAGAKHAPDGELNPWDVVETNTIGTRNVLDAFAAARVVLASTCKAADPETAYGASKLIAERMVLNDGGVVARFYNVVESAGNVFETWAGVVPDAPIMFTPARRHFISLREAVALLLWSAVLPLGRYAVNPGRERGRRMFDVARDLYSGRRKMLVGLRRGDRREEPLHAESEWTSVLDVPAVLRGSVVRIHSRHDP